VNDALHQPERIIYLTVLKDYFVFVTGAPEILVVLRPISAQHTLTRANLAVIWTVWNAE
jgi:hypothetical protein